MNVYIWTSGVLKNAYIGEYGWKPWSNTVAYYPLTSTTTVNDQSWNNRNLTNSWVTFWTYKWIDCAYSNMQSLLYNSSFVTNIQNLTISVRAYYVSNNNYGGDYNQMIWRWWGSSENFWPYIDIPQGRQLRCSPWWIGTIYPANNSKWMHVIVTYNGSNIIKLYVNWVLNATNSSANIPSWTNLRIWGRDWYHWWYGWLSEFIVETKVWTDAEILDYYNNTKSNYWL